MHAIKRVLLVAAVISMAGCPDQDKNASIEQMNAGIAAAQKMSYETAAKHFKDAVKSYEKNHQAWYSLGQIQARAKQWDKAAVSFENALKYHASDAVYHLSLGMAKFETGDKKVARDELEKAVKMNDRLYKAHWYLGRTYRDLGNPKKAAEAWTRAAQLNPFYGPPFTRLGELYLRWDLPGTAIRVLSQGAANVKGGKERSNVFYYLGLAHYEKKEWGKAIEAFTNALDANSGNDEALFQRGLSYKAKGVKGKAQKDLETFAKQGKNPFDKQQAARALGELMAVE